MQTYIKYIVNIAGVQFVELQYSMTLSFNIPPISSMNVLVPDTIQATFSDDYNVLSNERIITFEFDCATNEEAVSIIKEIYESSGDDDDMILFNMLESEEEVETSWSDLACDEQIDMPEMGKDDIL